MSLPIYHRMNLIRTPHKQDRLLIAPSHKKGDFDSHAVDCPFVFRHEGKFWMTYVGWDGVGYQTGLASSEDLLNWQKQGCILQRGAKGSVTEYNVGLTSILRDNDLFGEGSLKKVNGQFVGAYHAYPQPGYEAGPGAIGLCFSDDLKSWQVNDPILKAEPSNEWESGGLYKSWLLESGGTYYIFYNAKNSDTWPWLEQTGFATSKDLVHWERHAGNPVLRLGEKGAMDDQFASDPCILREGKKWLMFYFGLSSDGHARDSVAFSEDLKLWNKSGEVLIDCGSPGTVDSIHAHKPSIIVHNNRLYHYYCAVSPLKTGIAGLSDLSELRGITLATSAEHTPG